MKSDSSKIKYFAYCRKSTTDSEDKQIASIGDQKRELRDYANKNDLTIVRVFEESQSAHHRGRPIFEKMMNLLERGETNGLLVWHPNRIARNAFDGGWAISIMDEGKLTEIRTPYRCYGNYPDDKFFLQLEFGMAKKDSDDKGVAVKRRIKSKLLEGWRPGPAPIGYLTHGEVGVKTIIPDPERFHIVKMVLDEFLTGNTSVTKIRELATKKWGLRTRKTKRMGGKPLSMSHLYKILTDPFYHGWFWYKNPESGERELIKGSHDHMTTKEEYDRVQFLLGRKGKPQPKTREFSYTGAMTCGECDSGVTAEEKNQLICTNCKYKFAYENKFECPKCDMEIAKMRDPTILNYVYYHCTKKRDPKCIQPSIRVEDLETQIDKELKELQIDEDYLKLALNYLNERKELEVQSKETVTKSLQKTYNEVQERINNLDRMFTSSHNLDFSLYTPERFKELKAGMMKERNDVETQTKDNQAEVDKWLELSEQTFNFCAYARFHFVNGDKKVKRAIFSSMGSNLTLTDKNLNIHAYKPYLLIKKALASVKAEQERLEPIKSPYNKRKEAAFAASSPNWLPD